MNTNTNTASEWKTAAQRSDEVITQAANLLQRTREGGWRLNPNERQVLSLGEALLRRAVGKPGYERVQMLKTVHEAVRDEACKTGTIVMFSRAFMLKNLVRFHAPVGTPEAVQPEANAGLDGLDGLDGPDTSHHSYKLVYESQGGWGE